MSPRAEGAIVGAVVGAVTALVVAVCVVAMAGCGPSLPPATQQWDEGLWTAGDARCIATNPTRATIDACRDTLRIAACGPGGSFADAGTACQDVRLSDGGMPR